jgi:hypothetical protein
MSEVAPALVRASASSGAELIAAERARQIEAEGWTAEHDDTDHADGQLADAAACYALGRADVTISGTYLWPWANRWWKPASRVRELVKAGALIAAEIDRLNRLSTTHAPEASQPEALQTPDVGVGGGGTPHE